MAPLQRERGVKEVEAALADILGAERRLLQARGRLADVAFQHPFPGTGMPNPAVERLEALVRAGQSLQQIRVFLEAALRNGAVRWNKPADKRKLRDERRRLLCRTLFEFWLNSGRGVSYTSNPVTNKREGPLLSFVNDVVRLVTDPPMQLNGDTIKEEIEAYEAEGGVTDPPGPLRRATKVEAEAARLLAELDRTVRDPAARLINLMAVRDAVERHGTTEKRASQLRLAVLLSEALVARATGVAEKGQALKELALVLTALGEVTWDLHTVQEAMAVQEQALAVLAGAEHDRARASILLDRAMAEHLLTTLRGEVAPSVEMVETCRAALAALDPSSDPGLWANQCISLAVAIARQGNRVALNEAADLFLAALAAARRTGDERLLASVLVNLAICQQRRAHAIGDRNLLEEAKRHVDTAVAMLPTLDMPEVFATAQSLHLEISRQRIAWPPRVVPRPSRSWVKPRRRAKGQRGPGAASARSRKGHPVRGAVPRGPRPR